MIRELTKKLVGYQLSHPWHVLLIVLVLTGFVGYGFTFVTIKPSTEAILPSDNPVVTSLDTLRAQFYGDIVTLRIETEDATSSTFLQKIDAVTNRIATLDNVGFVQSPTTRLQQQYGFIPTSSETLETADYGSLIGANRDVAVIQVQTDTQAKTEEIRTLRDELEEALTSQGLAEYTQLTGYSMIDLDMFGVILADFSRITSIAFSVVLLVLYIIFRSVKKVLLAIAPVMFALTWMIGIGSMFGAEITIISMVSAAMIMGLGIDFGIHIVSKLYSKNMTQTHIYESMNELSKGLLGGALTTSTGFLALLAAQLTGMHSLGIYLAIGIFSAYIGVIVLLPTIIILLEVPQ
mgnify:CR=1 FL=1